MDMGRCGVPTRRDLAGQRCGRPEVREAAEGVGLLFILGVVVGIGAIVGGRAFSMPHASKAGVVGIVLVFAAIIGYLVLPGIVRAMTGSGCV